MPVDLGRMKRKYILIPLAAGAVAFTACKDKTTTSSSSSSDSGAPVSQTDTPTPAGQPIQASATAAERAAVMGFAKNLPKDLVSYEGVYNGRKAFEELLKTPIGEFILERMADEGVSLEDLAENEQMASQLAAYSEEYFMAYGKGTSETFKVGMQFLERAFFYGARTGIFAADAMVRENGDFNPDSPKVFLDGPLKGAPKELIAMFDEAEIPVVYQGYKISDADSRDVAAGEMQDGISMLGMVEGASEAITIKRGDAEFSGYKVSGAKLVQLLEAEEDGMAQIEQMIDATDITAFKAALTKKDLVVVSGVIGDYVMIFVGQSEDDLVLVDQAEDSVCANEKMAFLDGFLDKDILIAGYSDSKLIDQGSSLSGIGYRLLSSLAKGAGQGLSEASSLGDTRDVEALLESLADQGEKLAALFTATDAGYVAFIEDGVKMESFGGPGAPALDLGETHSLAPLETGENTVMFANWTDNEDYNQKVMEYIDTLGETSYLVTKRIAALDIDDGDFRDFKQGVDMFDSKFRSDALELWKALRGDLANGLGAESALVMDVNGTFPKVPDVPKAILDNGKTPRLAYVSQVADRSKLQASWSRLNTSAENILKTISEMSGNEIPMQVPMSSEKNDLKTWFIPIPFQNDDFVASVSVSDELFFASTSKTFSEGLAERFKAGGGTERNGAWLHVDFKVLNKYANDWLTLVSDNAETAFPNESAREDFVENKPKIEKAIKALGTLEKLSVHTRSEGGRTRISAHLQAK
ncbi:hypothetical protein JIN77_03355 [Verrucomicrobiaceae bacterium R5-34]|nr:hypothetical protein [Verrucomicrobiaceae bacterium R5-34]